jgi:glycosyltransferase involved in cell wall biosynthesis
MKLVIEKPVTVITPTVGSSKLKNAIESVANQTYKCKHLIVCDGPEYFDKVYPLAVGGAIQFCVTPENTGGHGFNGQRIYASYPHLVNSDYILFLDEDNWYEPDHVANLVETIERDGLDFAYSLRKIFDVNKNYLIDDNCESLGKWPIFFTHDNPQFLIDTSSYCFTKKFIEKTCHLWHSGAWGEDRRYYYAVKDHAKYNTSGKHTLCYRLEGNPNSVTEDFFKQGNRIQQQHYKGNFPWQM